MWRFVLISFGFLGLAFYELSGGADYAPSPDSLQVAWADKPLFAVPTPAETPAPTRLAQVDTAPDAATKDTTPPADSAQNDVTRAVAAALNTATPADSTDPADEQVARADLSLASLSADDLGRVTVTLAGASQGTALFPDDQLGLSGVGAFSADTLVQDVRAVPLTQAIPAPPADIRSVLRNRANMRSGPGTDYAAVDQLTLGAPVQVLDATSGWVRLRDLETGQTGWMADWLITASN